MLKKYFGLMILVIVLVAIVGCNSAQPAAPANTEAAASRANDEYIYVSAMGNLEFFNAHKYGWKWAGEQMGVKTTYVGPPDYDLNAMVAAFDQAIAKQPKGIVVFAVEPVLTPQINKAVEAGIPVVTVLGDLPESKRLAFVGSRQYDLGFLGGQKLAEAVGGKGQVAVLSIPGVQMFDDRQAGFAAAFQAYPDIEIVQVGDTKADTVTAINTAKDIMQRFPELVAFVATDSTGGIGAATAVEELGKTGKVKIIGMDRNSDVLEKIKKGTITGTVVQNDASMAYWALQVLMAANYNQAPLTANNVQAGVQAEPSTIFTAVNYADQSNLKYFLDANTTYLP
jgi:ribose transport system substrate-binding protein